MNKLTRTKYLDQIRPHYEIDIIKVLIGIRRAGKSELLKQIIFELKETHIKEEQIVYLNFEDLRNENYLNYNSLNSYLLEHIDEHHKTYIFLDEIQNVVGFEKVISSLKATQDVSIFITGSNSSILSGELATLIAGRYVSFTIHPFSFKEYVDLKYLNESSDRDEAFNHYLKWGGLPQTLQYSSEGEINAYLNDVFDSIVVKDILSRYDKKHYSLIRRVIEYLFDNNAKIFSTRSVFNVLSKENASIQASHIYEIVEIILEAKIVSKCQRYDLKGKHILERLEKYYVSDLGLKSVIIKRSDDIGFSIESVIYNELVSRGYQCYVGKTYKGEIDFIVFDGMKKCFIQVAYLLATQEVIDREFNAFSTLKDHSPKFVLSMDKLDFSRNGITHLNVIDFLLGEKDIQLL